MYRAQWFKANLAAILKRHCCHGNVTTNKTILFEPALNKSYFVYASFLKGQTNGIAVHALIYGTAIVKDIVKIYCRSCVVVENKYKPRILYLIYLQLYCKAVWKWINDICSKLNFELFGCLVVSVK